MYLHGVRSLDTLQGRWRRIPSGSNVQGEVRGRAQPAFVLPLPVPGVRPGAAVLHHVQRLPHHAARVHLRTYGYRLTLQLVKNINY